MIPRGVPGAGLKRCRRCGYEVVEVNDDSLCMSCEEYLYRLELQERRRRGYRYPAVPQSTGWPERLAEAIKRIRFWRD